MAARWQDRIQNVGIFAANFREKARKTASSGLSRRQDLAALIPVRRRLRRPATGAVMITERRKSQRRSFNRYARFYVEGGSSKDCLIVNVSDDGVRLHTDRAEVPDDFTLVMDDAKPPRRSCRVVWRLGYELGAKFTDIPAPAAARAAPEPANA
jgi:hypothetical protein